MLLLNRFRVKALDKYNITFEELKEVESKKKTKQKRLEWVRVGGYYGKLDGALKGLKDYILQEYLESDVSVDMLSLLDELNNKYVNCVLLSKEEEE